MPLNQLVCRPIDAWTERAAVCLSVGRTRVYADLYLIWNVLAILRLAH